MEANPIVLTVLEETPAADTARLAALGAFVVERLGLSAPVSVALLPDEEVARVNRQFFGRDGVTDVMAFPLPSEGPAEDEVTGEVLLCPGLAARQAREHGVTYQNELDRLLVHGLLHLAGRTDATADERTAMLAEGENLLAAFPAQS